MMTAPQQYEALLAVSICINLRDLPKHQRQFAIALGNHKKIAEHQGVLLQNRVGHRLGDSADNLARAGAWRQHLQSCLRLDLMEPVTQHMQCQQQRHSTESGTCSHRMTGNKNIVAYGMLVAGLQEVCRCMVQAPEAFHAANSRLLTAAAINNDSQSSVSPEKLVSNVSFCADRLL